MIRKWHSILASVNPSVESVPDALWGWGRKNSTGKKIVTKLTKKDGSYITIVSNTLLPSDIKVGVFPWPFMVYLCVCGHMYVHVFECECLSECMWIGMCGRVMMCKTMLLFTAYCCIISKCLRNTTKEIGLFTRRPNF